MNVNQPLYLFFDLDGTVLVKRKLPIQNLVAMKRAQAMGHKLILNTGRSRGSYAARAEQADAVPWDGMIFSAADINYQGDNLALLTVSEEDFHVWLEYCIEHRVKLSYCGREWLEFFDFTTYEQPLTEQQKDEHRAHAAALYSQNLPTTISVHTVLSPETNPTSSLRPIQLPTYVDLYPAGCDKGKVILDFCRISGVSIEQCVCFGDSVNDADMFRVCPTSVAMSYAPDELTSLATYVASGEFGVAEGLGHLLGFSPEA
jgi:HAD superfamily hydrolase (TIGR01484 family)